MYRLGLILCFCSLVLAEKVIRLGNGAEPKDLDPHLTTGVPEHRILINLFEALVEKDPKTLEFVPAAAEKWTFSKDKKKVTFNLRKNAKWSNGEPVTANDFVYSFQRLLTAKTASEYAYQGYYLKNGKDFHTGKITDPKKIGVEAKSDYVLEITLENPTPFILSLLTHHSFYPVPKKAIEKHGVRWTRPENIVVNGAFTISKWEINKIIEAIPNPHYWDRKQVKLDKVEFHPIENINTEERMFRAKQLDVTESVPLEKIPGWQADKSNVYQQTPYMGSYFFWINVTKAPLNNPLVRKALVLGFDREKIVKFVTRAGQIPASHFVPAGMAGYTPPKVIPTDLSQIETAKKLLTQAGYPGGKGLPPIEMLYNNNEQHKKIIEAIQQMWKENLGISVKPYNQEWKVYLDSLHTGNYQIGRAGWIADYNDPSTFFTLFITGNGNNNAKYSNKKYDELIAKSDRETNPKKRIALFTEAEKILLDELPLVPIYTYTRVYLKSTNVQGWDNNIEDYHPLKYVSLK